MVARWDAILLATAVAGGSMLIENSHRLDTGAPDEEVVATSACDTVIAARIWKPTTEDEGDDYGGGASAVRLPVRLIGRKPAIIPPPRWAACSWRSPMRADLPRRPRR